MTLPNFLIVGAPKAGTTALVEALRQHPEVYLPPGPVEPGFFAWDIGLPNRVDTWADYEALFEGATTRHLAIGEKTVWYLSSPAAPETIARFLPGVRIIVAVRDPVELVYSLHRQQLLDGNETIKDFSAAIDAETRRHQMRSGNRVNFLHGVSYSLIANYPKQIHQYEEHFGKDRVLIVPHNALSEGKFKTTMATVFRFLGLREDVSIDCLYPRLNRELRFLSLHRFLLRLQGSHYRWLDRLPAQGFLRGVKHRVYDLNAPTQRRPQLTREIRQRLEVQFRDTKKWLERIEQDWSIG